MALEGDQVASPEVMANGELIMSASISNFNIPLTSISWTQLGDPRDGSEDRVNITHSAMLPVATRTVTSTFILNQTIPADTGNYSVTATNDAGSDTFIFTVSVIGEEGVLVCAEPLAYIPVSILEYLFLSAQML